MYEDMMHKFTAQTEQAFAPARRFAQLTLDHAEKLGRFQRDAAQSYTAMGIEQVRGALSVSDSKTLQDYVSRQPEVASTVSRKLTDDAEAFAGFGKEYTESASKLAEQNVAEMQRAAAPKAKKRA